MAVAVTLAATGLTACSDLTDITPWAYPTEPETAQQAAQVEPQPAAVPPAYTAPRVIAAAPAPVSPPPPTVTYAPPRTAPAAVVAAPPRVVAAAPPVAVAAAAPRVVRPAPPARVTPPPSPPVVISAPAATTVYVPAQPMLTEKSGLIDFVLSDASGRPDGVILKDKTVIRFSPAFALAMDPDRSRLAPGRPLVVRGTVSGGRRAPVLNAVEMGSDIYSMVTLGY
ncbi:hypothetical protein ACFW16_04035 [Inquilinus sp. NPDC058860]|uniref:hypothetical protein n=1 Tax=Inquilinus sp. NPDC058860 TaxID=3346652 RepID=UPI003689EDF3